MTNPVVVAYARTPFTRSLVGGLANVSEFDLASTVIREVIDRAGVIRLKHTGPLTPEAVQQRVLPLLRELAPGAG